MKYINSIVLFAALVTAAAGFTCDRVPVYPEICGKPVPPDWEWGNPENYGERADQFSEVRSDIFIASYAIPSSSKKLKN